MHNNSSIFPHISLPFRPLFGYLTIIFMESQRRDISYWNIASLGLHMMTSSNGNIFRVTVNSPHKGQWRGAFMFSLICAWISRWVNNREAGDLRRYRAHYDFIVMTRSGRNLTVWLLNREKLRPSISLSAQWHDSDNNLNWNVQIWHIEAETKRATFCRRNFQTYFFH